MDLQLVEGALELPALRVERRELLRGGAVGIEDRGQEPVAGLARGTAGILDLVLDDARAALAEDLSGDRYEFAREVQR